MKRIFPLDFLHNRRPLFSGGVINLFRIFIYIGVNAGPSQIYSWPENKILRYARDLLFISLIYGMGLITTGVQAKMYPVRIKDIVSFEGIRQNQLVGYGLVVGLNGTGDTINNNPYTKESFTGMLERLGVNIRDAAAIGSNTVAAVMVTASLPPFARQGSNVDVSVSAVGSATDLRGGTLLVTPLLGADGDVYAVAQGPVAVGGFNATGKTGTKVTKGVPTSGKILSGAIVEKEVGFELAHLNKMNLTLRNPDFTTANRIGEVINKLFAGIARAVDPTTVSIDIPTPFKTDLVGFLTKLEQLKVVPDQVAKIVIDDQDGVIVMGEHVRISTVAVTHGSITIKVTETPQISQPNPFTQVTQATQVDRSNIEVKEEEGKFVVLEEGTTLQKLVNGLNALGVVPRDIITILRSMKAAGAIQAEIEVI